MKFDLSKFRSIRPKGIVLPPVGSRAWLNNPTDEEVERAIRSVPTHYSGVALNGSAGAEHYHAATTSLTFTFTVSAGSNLALLLTLNFGNASVSAISATWDSGGTNQAMSQRVLKQSTDSHPCSSAIFGLRNPAVGTLTLALSWTTSSEVMAALACFSGVNQTSDAVAFPHTAGVTIASNPGEVSLTSAVGNMVIGCQASVSSMGATTGTQIYNDHTNGSVINAMAEYDNGAASVTIGNTLNCHTLAAVDIAAAPAGPSTGGPIIGSLLIQSARGGGPGIVQGPGGGMIVGGGRGVRS